MALIKTTDEMRKYIRISASEKFESYSPYLDPACEKYIRPFLGDVLLTSLLENYNATTNQDEALDALLPYVQAPLAKFTLLLAIPNLDLNISEGGFTVISTNSQAPASRERVLALQASMEQQGWDAIESLLRFLEENVDDYSSWETSDAYTLAIRNLVNSARVFDEIFPIGKSRILFNRYRSNLTDTDLLLIRKTISSEMFDSLMDEIKAGTLSDANKKILPLLQRTEVLTAISENLDKSKYDGVGVEINTQFMRTDMATLKYKAQQFLIEALSIMKANPDDYPEYRDSDQYQPVETRFSNESDSGIYVFGGIT